MLTIRTIDGKDRPVDNRGKLVDIAGRVGNALAEYDHEEQLIAKGRAVAEAACSGDISTARRLMRRLTRKPKNEYNGAAYAVN